ncbi:hypothetical protein ACMU_17615 [Actibacterium mucosum KCTC 23349]|uniref:Divergent polysaccharide deacetylase n=2 Tax=Actibacterium TaxID=1433986 RepID=A0A037ZG72_9RHOB|nr:hypothetical protein ACMU_17615 [Actibacterium mucosum KCTC 23349]
MLRGLVLGGVTATVGLVVASQMSPLPEPVNTGSANTAPALDQASAADNVPQNRPERPATDGQGPAAGTLEVPAGSEFNRPPAEGEARLPSGNDPSVAQTAPGLSAGGDAGSLPSDTSSGTAPATETGALAALTPPSESSGDVSLPQAGSPVSTDQASAPAEPSAESLPQAPAQAETPAVVIPDQTAPAADASPAAPGAEQAAPSLGTAPEAGPQSGAPGQAPTADTASTPGPIAADQAGAGTAPSTGTAPTAPAPTETAPQPAPEVAVVTRPGRDTPLPEVENPQAPETEDTAAAPSGALRVPVPGREISTPAVRIGRLPTIGGDTPTETAVEAPSAEEEVDLATLGALSRYAAPFERQGDSPLFAIVLIDEGQAGLDRATLSTFSFPVTFAIDPTRPDAVEAMRAYRSAGFEVVLLARGLPEGASPSDLEVTLGTYLSELPETIAIMAPAQSELQSSRPLLQQLMAISKDTGHGVLTFDRGLNAAEQIARSADVPAAKAFRQLDADQESAATIRRYLSRAVFKAGQDGQVVMVGRSYADTVTALFAWALESEGDVTIAPLSAILRGQ